MINNTTLKLISLVVLTVQSSAFALVARKSRQPNQDGLVYFAGTAVFLMELCKLITSSIVILYRSLIAASQQHVQRSNGAYQALSTSSFHHHNDSRLSIGQDSELSDLSSFPSTPTSPAARRQSLPSSSSTLSSQQHQGQWSTSVIDIVKVAFQDAKELLWTPSALWLAVPAAAYVAQNNLQLIAATYLEPALFQTFSQAKIITTAGFSVLIMHRSLHKFQWLSIFMLASGLIVVHQTTADGIVSGGGAVATPSLPSHSVTLGFILMMCAALLSGFAGVFTERMLKQDKDFWATNFHMSAFSLLPASFVILSQYVQSSGFQPMHNFGSWAWATVLLNAFGGLIVSMVLKYADSIAKGFSLACAVILIVIVNVLVFGASFSLSCLVGIMAVLLSTTLYIIVGQMIKKSPSQPQAQVQQQSQQQEFTINISQHQASTGAEEMKQVRH